MQPISVRAAFASVEQVLSADIALLSSCACTDSEKVSSKQVHIGSVVLQFYVLIPFFAPDTSSRHHHLVRMGISVTSKGLARGVCL